MLHTDTPQQCCQSRARCTLATSPIERAVYGAVLPVPLLVLVGIAQTGINLPTRGGSLEQGRNLENAAQLRVSWPFLCPAEQGSFGAPAYCRARWVIFTPSIFSMIMRRANPRKPLGSTSASSLPNSCVYNIRLPHCCSISGKSRIVPGDSRDCTAAAVRGANPPVTLTCVRSSMSFLV